ncbi:MAG: transporter substrate-binding domain-containing protein [Stellaceae bacterium]
MAPSGVRKTTLPVGVVFSTTGSYRTIGTAMLNGALLAIEEINESSRFDFTLDPVIRDPGGEPTAYRVLCEELLRPRALRHIIGCYTSSSRKEVIPAIEKYDALLWYPSHYEGFESSNNVIYTGASPNQHIVPLLNFMMRERGRRVYCVGSNYIWAWENNRILREIVQARGGTVLGEKYLPVGSTDVDRFIGEIREAQPDFIFNTLIGESSYAFYRAYAAIGAEDKRVGPARIPVTSCSLSEPELLSIGAPAAAGHIASSVYFQSIDRPLNHRFVTRYRARFGAHEVTSADAEASYLAVILLARAISASGSTDILEVKKALYQCRIDAPQGSVRIDPANNHSYLTPALGISRADGQFDITWTAGEPVRPDPYLVWLDVNALGEGASAQPVSRDQRAHLRMVRE